MSLFSRPISLYAKVVITSSLILITAILFSFWSNLRRHEESIRRLTYEKTVILSEFIEKNVSQTMVEKGRHFEAQRVLELFAFYRGIVKINIVRPDGTIVASTNREDINKKGGDAEFLMENPYYVQEEMVRNKDGIMEQVRVHHFSAPISNQPQCYPCHYQGKKTIAILSIAHSLGDMDKEIYILKRDTVLIAIVTIIVFSLILGLLFSKFIDMPIKKLMYAMRRVGEGNLNVRVDVESKDEMGKLAASLNLMIEMLSVARKQAELYHQEMIQRADRMASIGELASGIAHEIRNPLAGIHGAIQILAEGFPREDERRQITDEIQKQIHKLDRIVKDLLNYAKPAPADYVPVDINQMVDKVLSFFIIQSGKVGEFKIEKRFSPSLPKALIDPYSMEQAFLNIIINAQKAMLAGGTFTVSTYALNHNSAEDNAREIQIVFEDTGVGISEGDMAKIFNPFFSTRSDGTGLGLSITKNIVEQHRGRIEVGSKVNAGTKFIITLPVAE
jgi:hypothetical protein